MSNSKGNEWTRKPRETREAGWFEERFHRRELSRFEPLNLRGDDTGSGARTALSACSSDNPFARTRMSALQSHGRQVHREGSVMKGPYFDIFSLFSLFSPFFEGGVEWLRVEG